jgi:hypothetical protein
MHVQLFSEERKALAMQKQADTSTLNSPGVKAIPAKAGEK